MASNLEGSFIDQLFLSFLIASAIVVLLRRRDRVRLLISQNKTILLFFLYLGLSVLWSDIPWVSARRWLRLLGGLLVILVVLTEHDPIEAVSTILRRCAYLLIPLSVLYIKYFPSLGVLYTYTGEKVVAGVALEKNTLGHLCAVSALFLIWSIATRQGSDGEPGGKTRLWIDLVVLGLALWLLSLSSSSTSIVAFIVAVGVLALLRIAAIRRNAIALGIFAFLVTVSLVPLGLAEFIVGSVGRDTTFTGRMPLWEMLIELGLERPILGYGYGGFWFGDRLTAIWDRLQLTFFVGHNGYLEIFVEGGLLGVSLLALSIIAAMTSVRALLSGAPAVGALSLGLLSMVLLCNITETSFARPQNYLWIVFLLVGLSAFKLKGPAR